MPQPVMLCALQDLEFRLNGMLLCVGANTSVSQEESWIVRMNRDRKEREQLVQGYCDRMNAFYAGDCDVFPDFVVSDESRFTETHSYIIDAWVKSTCKRMDLFYSESQNQIPFPSLRPPTCVAKSEDDVRLAIEKVYKYYKDGMPWPGYWAFHESQFPKFGTPMDCEIEFRENGFGNKRSFVQYDYLDKLVIEFRSIQDAIIGGEDWHVNTDVIDFSMHFVGASRGFSISYINVRPCFQRKGLFTVFLFIVIEASLAKERFFLGVRKAIGLTQELFLKYGFAEIEGTDQTLVDMQLQGKDAMQKALNLLRRTNAVRQMGNLCDLNNSIRQGWKCDECGGSCIAIQEPEIQRLYNIKEQFFRHLDSNTLSAPERVYYLDPKHYPTASELRNPEYVQAQFPKPLQTLPPRYAPGQLPGYVAPGQDDSSGMDMS